jgi:hypothetical protein
MLNNETKWIIECIDFRNEVVETVSFSSKKEAESMLNKFLSFAKERKEPLPKGVVGFTLHKTYF